MNQIAFPIDWVRNQFPALNREEIFADNAAGTQLPKAAIDSQNHYFTKGYALGGSTYGASKQADVLSEEIRSSFAQLLGARSTTEIHFGLNATTLFRLLATAMDDQLQSGDEIILTSLDHEANITPWIRWQKKGVKINYWQPRGPERILALGDLKALLNERTKYVMVTGASNVLGTLIDIKSVVQAASDAGSRVIVDAVHLAPHRAINVTELGVDALTGSGYKLFGPKLGFMYLKSDLHDKLPTLNHYFLDGVKLETGAPNYEAMAAFRGVFSYLSELAKLAGKKAEPKNGIEAAVAHEKLLTKAMIDGIKANDELILHGIVADKNLSSRLPTFALRHARLLPAEMAGKLAAAGIHCRHGHMYAPRLIESLKLRTTEGVCRLSLAHYNSLEDVKKITDALNNM